MTTSAVLLPVVPRDGNDRLLLRLNGGLKAYSLDLLRKVFILTMHPGNSSNVATSANRLMCMPTTI